jgi:cytochrome c553
MKRRAKLEKQSIASRVAQWDAVKPNLPAGQVAKELKLTLKQVYNARTTNGKKAGVTSGSATQLDERDIVAISKIGIAKTERILNLLKRLK